MDKTFTCTDLVDQHLINDALHHYRFHLMCQIDGDGGDVNNPDVANNQEWLDRCKMLEAKLREVIS